MFDICGYNPLVNDINFNLTYDEILDMPSEMFWTYVEYMRSRIREVWDEQGIAPSTGWSDEDVRQEFGRLNGFPVDAFWHTCELTGNRVIHNTHVLGNAVNAWNLSRMLKVRINYTEADNGRSIYDFFAKDELFAKYKPYARRHILRDSFYFFAQTVQIPSEGVSLPHRPEFRLRSAGAFVAAFAAEERPYGEYELLIEAKKKDKGYSGYAEHLQKTTFAVLSFDELKAYSKRRLGCVHVLPPVCLRVLRKKELNDEHEFHVRMYRKGQKLFPAMFKSFRVSMCQYAVNFPPLTAKLLYQTFLKDLPGEELTVWDPSSGWAGRILGAMSSELSDFQSLHYIGTDPNPDFYHGTESTYGAIADYYNAIRASQSLFGEHHRYTMFCSGSELVQHNPDFKRHKGTLDLVFTSPPYFNREAYSEDEAQSFKRFGTYDAWRDGFLHETLKTAYDWLKPNRYLLWNIADLKVGKKYLPLQQDSIAYCKQLGFEHTETIYMTLRGMPGANRVDENGELTAKNMCKVKGKLYKYEPVLVFRKP